MCISRELCCSCCKQWGVSEYPCIMHWPWPTHQNVSEKHVLITHNLSYNMKKYASLPKVFISSFVYIHLFSITPMIPGNPGHPSASKFPFISFISFPVENIKREKVSFFSKNNWARNVLKQKYVKYLWRTVGPLDEFLSQINTGSWHAVDDPIKTA